MENLNGLIKKLFSREVIFYAIFGVLTTIVNISVFYVLTLIGLEENISNIIAIIIAVLFAYITNRKLVFNSTAKGFKEIWTEFYKFNLMHIHELISKIFITILVIILNFFISKFFAFKKSN